MSNLLPQDEKKVVRREYKLRVLGVFLLLLAVVQCFGVVFLLPAYLYTDAQVRDESARLSKIPKLESADEQVFVSLRKISKNAEAAALDPRTPFSATIDLLLKHTGNGLRITSFSIDEKSPTSHELSMNGRANTRQTLLDFKNAMEAEPGIGKGAINIPVSAFAEESNISFSAKITVRFGEEGKPINTLAP